MRRTCKTPLRPAFDTLDDRCLLSGGIKAALAAGTLTVNGTGGSDVINVTVNVRTPVRAGRPAVGTVSIAGIARKFNAQQVRQIVVNGGDGDDDIAVSTRGQVGIPFRVDGGAGSDTVNGVRESTITQVPTPPLTPGPAAGLSAVEQQIIDLTNAERRKAGLAPLAVSARLQAAARVHAENMARLNSMSHTLPVPGAETPEVRVRAAGYAFAALGENIAYNYADATAVVAGWVGSPGHRANLLNPDYTEIGVGVALNSLGEPYYVQTFGRPQ